MRTLDLNLYSLYSLILLLLSTLVWSLQLTRPHTDIHSHTHPSLLTIAGIFDLNGALTSLRVQRQFESVEERIEKNGVGVGKFVLFKMFLYFQSISGHLRN